LGIERTTFPLERTGILVISWNWELRFHFRHASAVKRFVSSVAVYKLSQNVSGFTRCQASFCLYSFVICDFNSNQKQHHWIDRCILMVHLVKQGK